MSLSPRALELLNKLSSDKDNYFDLSATQLDSIFRKIKKKAMIDDLQFHDTRHEAITRLAKN